MERLARSAPFGLGGSTVGAPIDADVTIEEIVGQMPEASAILRRLGLVCTQCGESVWGTPRQAAARNGMSDVSEVLPALQKTRGIPPLAFQPKLQHRLTNREEPETADRVE